MQRYSVPYGKGHLGFELPDDWLVEEVLPKPARAVSDPRAAVEAALDDPVGEFSWARVGSLGAPTVAIAVNDKTRPVPHGHLLPPLLERLEGAGVRPENILLLVATGTHPPMTEEEFFSILPAEIVSRYPIVSHDATRESELVQVGTTARGTPVRMNRRFLDADLRIVCGNIEPHQFMGFSGGVKSAVIGLAAKDTIDRNHMMMTRAGALPGHFEDNPPRQDVEEMGRMVRVDLALNAILNDAKQIIDVLAGEPVEVMKRGIPRVRELYELRVSPPFDLVIASPGGHPKDINVYQAQKALAHASLITRDGGGIVVTALCPEGSGSRSYEDWVSGRGSHEQVLRDFEAEGFRIGPHKAFQVAREATRFRTRWVTELPGELAERLLLETCDSVEAAVDEVLGSSAARPRVGIMPAANATIATTGDTDERRPT